jgi:hypothetical protein
MTQRAHQRASAPYGLRLLRAGPNPTSISAPLAGPEPCDRAGRPCLPGRVINKDPVPRRIAFRGRKCTTSSIK